MYSRKGKVVAATVAAVVIGLVGQQWRANAQGEKKPPARVTPAVVFVEWGPDERPADRGQFFKRAEFEVRSGPIAEIALTAHPE
ncbi:MAG TPA: hypothetical protein VGH33_24335, partial [Isosphaeraceae bacterium]